MNSLKIIIFIISLSFLSSCSVNDEELYSQVNQLIKEKKIPEAIETLKKIVDKKPYGAYGEKAQYQLISLYHTELQNPQMAIAESRNYVSLYADSAKTPSVFFMIGFIFNNELHQMDSARAMYTAFLAKYPNSEMASSAQYELQNLGKDVNEVFKAQLTDTSKKEGFTVQSNQDTKKDSK